MLYTHHLIRAALSQPSSRDCNVRIHAVTFDLSIHATSFKLLRPLSRNLTSPYSCHSGAALMQQHPEDLVRKKPQDPLDGRTEKVSIEI